MSSPERLVVLGGGGHAKVVAATALAAGYSIAGVFDDDSSKWGTRIGDTEVVGPVEKAKTIPNVSAVLAIGENRVRRMRALELKLRWTAIVHPSAILAPRVELGAGTVVFAQAVIQPDSVIGEHVVINTAASIDHDCRVGDFSHIAPGVHIAGGVSVGEGALLGIGSCAIPRVSIGAWAIVGAGAVVTHAVPAGARVAGVPARRLDES